MSESAGLGGEPEFMQHICLWSVLSAAMAGPGEKLLWACPQDLSSLVRADSNE